MHPATLITRDATRLAILHCRAAQSRAHRHHLQALHSLAVLMRSPTAPWYRIAHCAALASHYEEAAHAQQRAAAYFAKGLNTRAHQTEVEAATTHYQT